MEPEALEPEQFWNELEAIVSKPAETEDLIDDALRAYLSLTTLHKGNHSCAFTLAPNPTPSSRSSTALTGILCGGLDELLPSEWDISQCSYKLFASSIFGGHADYVRRQIIYGLLQDDDPNTLHMIASFLLFDGRQNEEALQMMNEEGVFARLLELIQALRRDEMDGGAGLHRLLMDLLYEMSRIQRIKIEDLVLVNDDFIRCLFDIIEDLSYDVTDPYHYPVIRVLLVLNEQFMISAHDPVDGPSLSSKLTNKVIKILSAYGSLYKTFGENIILLINREAETSLQLLTLKLLYLIFTTPSTYEYFFTNDLHVLVDILIRNLLDLPEEASALRHTYLRVLYPLLAHTQLRLPPFYKRDELRKLLNILVRGQVSYGNETERETILHFEEVDETTRRLVSRCATVDWLRDVESESATAREMPAQTVTTTIDTVLEETSQQDSPIDIGEPLDMTRTLSRASTIPDSPGAASPTRIDSRGSSEAPESRRKLSAVARLGMNLEPATSSSLSVQAVAAQHEKPGIITPSRKDGPVIRPPKIKPEPPKARRWRGRRLAGDEDEQQQQQQHSAGTSSERNSTIIPEDAEVEVEMEVSPTSTHTAPSPTPTPSGSACASPSTSHNVPADRRNSTSSHLIPPIPTHARRSASNPPPALPPPRRSTTSTPSSSQHRPLPPPVPVPTPSPTAVAINKHGAKPLPPKTRRWGRGKTHAATDSVESGISTGSTQKDDEAEMAIVTETVIPPLKADPEFQHGDNGFLEGDVNGNHRDPFSPTSPTSPTLLVSPSSPPAELESRLADKEESNGSSVPISVEEAVHNVSLH
ncbi:uncharacterized protein N7483_004444 [Penicillium malachiteum]|uniref:uncharacterized protein n=1 Tax=Penicillium malachiteum TaxID=1324776 RepID=UPI0025496976|nr:uncharacterized protein N7483_004444 [Penicillium malachiteum]KAJ5729936.1 hypothetical protein N7483_004444 [Penicillium malachiteum]